MVKTEKPIDRWLAVGGIAVGIVLFLAPKTTLVIVSLLILVFALMIHPIWHFWWIEKRLWRKLLCTILFVWGLVWFGRISWPSESTGFGQVAASASGWIFGPHGRWLDKVIGAIYALSAVSLLFVATAVIQSLKKHGNQSKSQKGFLDYKLDAEMAIAKMPQIVEKLTRIMAQVGP